MYNITLGQNNTNYLYSRAALDSICINAQAMDIAIPVAVKDYIKLNDTLHGIFNHSKTPIQKIYVIAKDEQALKHICTPKNHSITLIKENAFPFTKDDIASQLAIKESQYNHAGWYYQQLLKLYVFKVIKNAHDNILVLDSDFIVTQPIEFIAHNGKAIMANGYPLKWLLDTVNYPKNVEHIQVEFGKRFIPSWDITSVFSGMQHHMLLQKEIMQSMFFMLSSIIKSHFGKLLCIQWIQQNGMLHQNICFIIILLFNIIVIR